MALPRCPSCAAPFEERQTDPLVRCPFCGGLLAVDQGREQPFEAPPRVTPEEARALVGRAPVVLQQKWRPGFAELYFYPFEQTGQARQSLVPRSDLPPSLAETWNASGADLLALNSDSQTGSGEDGIRLPASIPVTGKLLYYPFYRVRLAGEDEETACWVDAIDGQLMLPLALQRRAEDTRSAQLADWWKIPGGVALAAAFLLPTPLTVLAVAIGGAVVYAKAAR